MVEIATTCRPVGTGPEPRSGIVAHDQHSAAAVSATVPLPETERGDRHAEAEAAVRLIQEGHVEEAMTWAARLALPVVDETSDWLDTNAAVNATAARLWVAWTTGQRDGAARDLAALLLRQGGGAPRSRAFLHYQWAMHELATSSGLCSDLRAAREQLRRARTLAGMLGWSTLDAAACAGTAMADLAKGNLASASLHARAAMAADCDDAGGFGSWSALARGVENAVRHLQGQRVVDCARDRTDVLLASGLDPIVGLVMASVDAFSEIERDHFQLARAKFNILLEDSHFARLPGWRGVLAVMAAALAARAGDQQQLEAIAGALMADGAGGDAVVVRALRTACAGRLVEATDALRAVTSARVPSSPFTLASAAALEIVLLERQGNIEAAARSLGRAVTGAGLQEPVRIFELFDVGRTVAVLRRLVDANFQGVGPYESLLARLEDRTAASPPLQLVPDVPGGTDSTATGALAAASSPLTDREREVLTLVHRGASQADLARELYVSANTIKTHLRSIRQKLGVDRTGEAATIALHAGWLAS